MTEAEWLACADARPMLDYIRGRASGRKSRLFACAYCDHRIEDDIRDEAQGLIETGERLAEGGVSGDELEAARSVGRRLIDACPPDRLTSRRYRSALYCLTLDEWSLPGSVIDYMRRRTEDELEAAGVPVLQLTSAAILAACDVELPLLREILGNPFRPVAFDPAWLTSPVLDLARTMYDGRDFSAMPILADALEEAGCDNADVLAHCRGDGPHVRGCWVVDAILGKE